MPFGYCHFYECSIYFVRVICKEVQLTFITMVLFLKSLTELLVTYLDQVTTPLVHVFPSFVKKTIYMIQISEETKKSLQSM